MFEMQKQFQEVKLLHSNSAPKCVTFGGLNCGERCLETISEEGAKYMGQAPFSNNYNSGWKNHPNLSWRDQGNSYQKSYSNQNFQGQRPQEQGKSNGKKSLEELLEGLLGRIEENHKAQEARNQALEAVARDHGAATKNLEVQVGQIVKQLSERPAGKFLGDTQKPSTEHAFAITTRSRKVLHHVEKPTGKE
jgi:hypothetical protein